MARDSNSGHQLLLPPANWCPIFALPDHAQAHALAVGEHLVAGLHALAKKHRSGLKLQSLWIIPTVAVSLKHRSGSRATVQQNAQQPPNAWHCPLRRIPSELS